MRAAGRPSLPRSEHDEVLGNLLDLVLNLTSAPFTGAEGLHIAQGLARTDTAPRKVMQSFISIILPGRCR